MNNPLRISPRITLADRVKTPLQRIRARGALGQNPAMTHITGHDHSQILLLPESLEDDVSLENPVRFIETFVDGLDLTTAGCGALHGGFKVLR
jgi:hypothetical protein